MLKKMPLEDVKTISELLTPISENEPCGPYLKRDPLISRLKDLRSVETSTASGVWKVKRPEDEEKANQINESISLSEEFLMTQSKDLWVAVYYTEALIKEYGFFGLAHGLELIAKLCSEYWEQVHPGLEEGQAATRLTTFRLLNNILLTRLVIAPIVMDDEKIYNIFEITKKVKGHQPTQVKNQTIALLAKENENDLKNFKIAIESSIANLDAIEARGLEIDEILESADAPSFRPEMESLELVLSLLKSALNPAEVKAASQDVGTAVASEAGLSLDEVIDVDEMAETAGTPMNLPSNPIKSIQDAYKMISKINEYLLKNDTHSPCPALIQRAIEWRKKDMYELYSDIFASISRPDELFALLALKPKPQPAQPSQAPQTPPGGMPPAATPSVGAPGMGSPYGSPTASPYGSGTPGPSPYSPESPTDYGSPYGGGYNPYGTGGNRGGGGGYGGGGYGGGY